MAKGKAAAPPPATEGGQAPFLATKGKARAAGNLDVIKPGDPDHGKSNTAPRGKGLRVESEKGFQLDADSDEEEMVRVFDAHPEHKGEDVVLFSGTRKQFNQLKKAIQKDTSE